MFLKDIINLYFSAFTFGLHGPHANIDSRENLYFTQLSQMHSTGLRHACFTEHVATCLQMHEHLKNLFLSEWKKYGNCGSVESVCFLQKEGTGFEYKLHCPAAGWSWKRGILTKL